jgi:hypothetical protein
VTNDGNERLLLYRMAMEFLHLWVGRLLGSNGRPCFSYTPIMKFFGAQMPLHLHARPLLENVIQCSISSWPGAWVRRSAGSAGEARSGALANQAGPCACTLPKFQNSGRAGPDTLPHFRPLSFPHTFTMANNAVSSQPALKGDGIAALPHTEAHYFNRFASPLALSGSDRMANSQRTATTTMVGPARVPCA